MVSRGVVDSGKGFLVAAVLCLGFRHQLAQRLQSGTGKVPILTSWFVSQFCVIQTPSHRWSRWKNRPLSPLGVDTYPDLVK